LLKEESYITLFICRLLYEYQMKTASVLYIFYFLSTQLGLLSGMW